MTLSFSECLTIFVYCSCALTKAEIQITGYPGTHNQDIFNFNTHAVPWREAVQGCTEDNTWILGLWYQGISYVKNVVVKAEGLSYEGFWINNVHYAGESEYRRINSCEDGFSEQEKQQINGYNISLRQCLYVNVSLPNTDATNIFAGPCDKKLPYVCQGKIGHYSGDPDSITTYTDTKFKTSDNVKELVAINLDECIFKLFKNFKRYAAEFNNSTQKCRTKIDTSPSELPKVFEIEPSTDRKIVVLKNSKPVVFNFTIKNVQPIDWPCLSGPVPESSASQVSTSLTSTISLYPSIIFAGYSTFYHDSLTNETCCACSQTRTYGEVVLLTLLDKRSLSRYRRKKISASDSRVSATTIGCFGAVTLFTICSVIIFSDIHSMFTKTRRKPKIREKQKL